MKLEQIKQGIKTKVISEANVAAKILKDPKLTKMLAIAMRHDSTLPRSKVAKLGPNPADKDVVQLWSDLLDDTLRRNNYGDLSQDGKFDDWLTRLYINGVADFEDINGEGGDALGAWKALSIRGKLKPEDQDFNKFKNIKQLQRIRNNSFYRQELERIKDQEHIAKMKREAKEIVLIDDERFRVIAPMNYGSCYSTDKAGGYIPNFCTGSSSGATWFGRYSPDGMIVNIVDKENIEDVNAKWQFHAATNQLVRGDQERRHDLSYNDQRFAELFPGLMKRIADAILAHADQIKELSKEITPGGYDAAKEVELIKKKYPLAYASGQEPEPAAEPEPAPEEPPVAEPAAEPEQHQEPAEQTFIVTQLASGRTARISGRDLADVQAKVLRRYPDSTIDDYTWETAEE